MSSWLGGRALGAACLGLLAAAAPAAAASRTVDADGAAARACHPGFSERREHGHVPHNRRERSIVSARLRARATGTLPSSAPEGRLVAGSSAFAGNELAQGFVRRGERLTVQACRFRGSAASARVSVSFTALGKRKQGKVQMVDVTTRSRAEKNRLQALGLDLTEHGDANSIAVVLHGARDARILGRAGFRYRVRIADMAARTRRNRQRDARYARASAASGLPSGSDSYRRLADYETEMKQLALQYPTLVQPVTLSHRTCSAAT